MTQAAEAVRMFVVEEREAFEAALRQGMDLRDDFMYLYSTQPEPSVRIDTFKHAIDRNSLYVEVKA
jgi:hypothetical protein